MRLFTSSTVPSELPYLVASANPIFAAGALIPGVPCPCVKIPLSVGVSARNYQRTENSCGVEERTTIITKTKNEFPGGDSAALASWNAAWGTITETLIEVNEGPPYSAYTQWFYGPDSTEGEDEETDPLCGMLEGETTYDPGPPEENPGNATYSSTTEIEETFFDIPGNPDTVSFRGEFANSVNQSVAQTSLEGDPEGPSSNRFDTEWRWVIDLTGWPSSRPWPAGYVIEGFVVWTERVRLNAETGENEVLTPFTDTIMTEAFALTEEEPRWEGEVRIASATVVDEPGKTSRILNVLRSDFALYLPFE